MMCKFIGLSLIIWNNMNKKSTVLQIEISQSKYRYLVDEDQINLENMSQLNNDQFKNTIDSVLRDIISLLFMESEEFWMELEKDRVKVWIAHLLKYLPRKSYQKSIRKSQSHKYKSQHNLTQYEALLKLILTLYHRIANASNKMAAELVFNNWYIDSVKCLDLCAVYGESNKSIIKDIISKMFQINKDGYNKDFIMILNLSLKLVQDSINYLNDYQVNFVQIQQTALTKYSHFGNPVRVSFQKLMQTIFGLYDILINLSYILMYFPSECKVKLLSEALLYKKIVLLYNYFIYDKQHKWIFRDCDVKHVGTLLTQVETAFVRFFMDSFELIGRCISNEKIRTGEKALHRAIQKTYINLAYFMIGEAVTQYQSRDLQGFKKVCLTNQQLLFQNIILMSYVIQKKKNSQKKIKISVIFSQACLKTFDSKKIAFKHLVKAQKFQQQILKVLKQQQQAQKLSNNIQAFIKNMKIGSQMKQKYKMNKINLQYDDEPQCNDQSPDYPIFVQLDQSCQNAQETPAIIHSPLQEIQEQIQLSTISCGDQLNDSFNLSDYNL